MIPHAMLDFETLGTAPDTAVVSLGLVIFTREKILHEKLWLFDLRGQLANRRSVTAETITWWMGQGKAKDVFELALREGVYLRDFAFQLKEICLPFTDLRVWGNGAAFDLSIVEHILHQQGVKPPWKYSNQRCYRTLRNCFGFGGDQPFHGTKHDALDDARHQANCLMGYFLANPEADK